MDLLLKVDKAVETKSSKGSKYRFELIPDGFFFKKKVKLVVVTDDPNETMGDLGLPQSIGDTVKITSGKVNAQTSLKKKE